MALKQYKPTSPGRRFATVSDFVEITADAPHHALTRAVRKTGGRNNYGRVSTRHRGGGNKIKYRVIDFKRNKDNVAGTVETIEYDPNRNTRIALIKYADGERRYILAPKDLNVGDVLNSGEQVEPKVGNCMPMKNIPTGMAIHNIELSVGRGGQLVRSAGGMAQLMAREGRHAHVLLPSGEMRKIFSECRATIGQLGNIDYKNIWWGKAGRRRWLGWRPTVRGTAQNPVSHPMGGGEGRTGGGRHPCGPTGVLSKGGKTRKKRKPSSNLILRGRKKGRFQQT